LYILVIAFLLFFNPPLIALWLPMVPILLAAALYEIRGGLAAALLGILVIAFKTTQDAGWPWTPEYQSMNLITISTFVGFGALAGWISQRDRRRDKLIRDALAETDDQRQQFLAVLENAPMAVLIADRGGFLQMANRAALEALDLKPPVALGQDIASIAPDKTLADMFYKATLGGEAVSGEVSGPKERSLSVSISPVPGVGNVAVMQDITDHKLLNQRKNEMISTVSHDLKNPLTAIQGYADLVFRTGDLSERQEMFLQRVRLSASRMIELITDLLDVAWIESGMEMQRERTDLSVVATETVREFQTEIATKSLELKKDLTETGSYVIGDKLRLRQMSDNLVSNAIKYTDKGGKVTVTLKREGDQVHFAVKDTGVGISEANMDKIFERYFRVDETAEQVSGSGLGLAIVKAIVEQHGGSVEAKSEEGKGSTFTVKLPASNT
jgi:PAS domain S-box-containing protein